MSSSATIGDPRGYFDGLSQSVPNLHDYFGVWAVHAPLFRAAVERFNALDLRLHIQQQDKAEPKAAARGSVLVLDGGIAIIELRGTLMKQTSSLEESTSTIAARRQIRNAASDPRIKAILLVIDSPGGTVSGTQALADDVAAAAKQKPLHVQIEDLGASAAFWVASQATKVFANATALVGSIGTFAVIHDLSEHAAEKGIKVHVVRAGKFKGTGVAGTEITDDQLAMMQTRVDGLNEFFVAGVAAGRNMSIDRVRSLADGAIHLASEAKTLGLIDGVQSLDETIDGLQKLNVKSNAEADGSAALTLTTKEIDTMSEATLGTTPLRVARAAATCEELQACIPGVTSDFIVAQLEKNATLDQAQSSWMEQQNERIAAAEKEAADAKAAQPTKGGLSPVGTGKKVKASDDTDHGDAIESFGAKVAERMAAGSPDRQAAVAAVVKANPELHRAFLLATNPQGSHDTIDRKFDAA